MSQIGLKGGPELLAFLDSLPEKMEKNVLRGAMRAAARVVQKEARRLAPDDSGQLRKSLKISTNARNGTITATLASRGRHSYLAPFMEYGTAAHWITVRGSGAVAQLINAAAERHSLKIGTHFVGQSVFHPGNEAHPFMRPALDTRAADAVRAAAGYISTRLSKEGLNAPDLTVDDQ